MSRQANITAVDALDSFRSALVIYLSKARPALGEIGSDVLRMRMWLQNDQRQHWEREKRRRLKVLEQAQQELFTAGLANLREVTTAEQMAVRQAKRAVDEAEQKLQVLKRWNRDFDSQVEPLARQLEKLDTLLTVELPKAIAYLSQATTTLNAYAAVAPPEGSGVAGGISTGERPAGGGEENLQTEDASAGMVPADVAEAKADAVTGGTVDPAQPGKL